MYGSPGPEAGEPSFGTHIAERIIRDGMIDMAAYRPVARLGYMDYTSVETVFEMLRPD